MKRPQKQHSKNNPKLIHVPKFVIHGETFYINFYYSIFQFRKKRITLRIFFSKNTKLYNNGMKL